MGTSRIVRNAAAGLVGLVLLSSGLSALGVSWLPNPIGAAVEAASGDGDPVAEETPSPTPVDRPAAARAYAEAIREWTACVDEAFAAQGAEASPGAPERADPREACGPQPKPADFGLDEAPSPAPTPTGTPSDRPIPHRRSD